MRNLIISKSHELDGLMQSLLSKDAQDFVFRGHANSSWKLKPKLFREEEIKKLWSDYGLTPEAIQQEWFENDKTLSALSLYSSGNGDLITKKNYKEYAVFHKGKPIPVLRLLWSYIDMMKYNYCLRQYVTKYANYYTAEYLKKIENRPLEFWRNFDNFLPLLVEVIYIVDRYDIRSGKLLNNPEIFNDITGYDETRPQHFDIATSALDWTRNPWIALYFASRSFMDNCPSNMVIPFCDAHITLFAYKQLKNNQGVSVVLQRPNENIENERAVKQEGCFTFLPKARSFYLINGVWPEIEKDYYEMIGDEFLLERYNIFLSEEIIAYIQYELKNRKINHVTMGLER